MDLAIRVVVGHSYPAAFFNAFRTASVADVAAQPGRFRTPENILIGFPSVLATAAEAESLEAHCFEGNVAGEDHQVGPGDLAAIFLFDRPEQAARLVEADIVRPTVEGCESLLAPPPASAAIQGAVGAGTVPRHANEQGAVVAEVGRPPILRVSHEGREIFLERDEVKAVELFGV